MSYQKNHIRIQHQGFPGSAVVESLPANVGDTGSSPGLGRSHMPRSSWAREPQLLSLRVWNKNHIHRKIDKMKRQRAMYQMKEQEKTPEKQLNEVEIGNLPE